MPPLGQLLIYIVCLAGAIALTYIGLKQLGVTIPQWVVQVFWVVVVVVVICFAIRFVFSV